MAITRRVTLEEFLKLPEEEPALEYFDGRVTQKVSPKVPHSAIQYRLAERINRFAAPRRLAFAFPELRATFAGASSVPDLAVYRWDRIPRQPSGEVAVDALDPPDIAIEIVSPGQSISALNRRCLWFVGHGMQVAMLINPRDRSVLLFRANSVPLSCWGEDRVDLDDVLPGFELTVDELFGFLRFD